MKLYFAPNSPYARKCRVIILEKGLQDRVEGIIVMPLENPPELLAISPLATVPALLTDNSKLLCESPVICEYLNSLAPEPQLFPGTGKERFDMLGLAALADGVMDAAVACVLEGRRPAEKRWDEWINRKETAIRRTIALLAHRTFEVDAPLHIGIINTLVALNYVSFRLPHIDWREKNPALAAWYDKAILRPSFAATAPIP